MRRPRDKESAAFCHVYSFFPSLKHAWNSYYVSDAVAGSGERIEDKISVLKGPILCFSNIGSNFITYSGPDLQTHRHPSS